MATTLDPANIHNFSGTGSLSNGNLTIASTGNSTGQSTTAITTKKTFQSTISAGATYWVFCGLSSSSAASDGFSIGYEANWVIKNSAGSVVFNGPSSPAPAAGMVITVDVDPVGKTVSVRANGTSVFSNKSISTQAPATWRAIVWATDASASGTTFTSTVKFSGLTYAPLSGFSEWDGASVSVAATAGTAKIKGSAGVVSTSANKKALAVAGHLSHLGSAALVQTDTSVRAGAGAVHIIGQDPVATIDNITLATAGHAAVIGDVGVVSLSDNRIALASPGSLAISGAVPAVSITQDRFCFADSGSVGVTGDAGYVLAKTFVECFAIAGSVAIFGAAGRVFSLMPTTPDRQTAIVQPENRLLRVPQERRTSLVVGDRDSSQAPERRNSAA